MSAPFGPTAGDPRRHGRRRNAAGPLMLLGITLAACGGAPARPQPDPTAPQHRTDNTPSTRPTTPELPADEPPPAQMDRLGNGLAVYAESLPVGSDAQVQLGVLAGSVFVAPGLAELAAQVFVHSSDPSVGRQSLAATIARTGGSVEIRVGMATTWIDVRVPPNRLQTALGALRTALDASTHSRSQIERMRDELIARRTRETLRDPLLTNARALMHAEAGSAGYLGGLLDLDASQVPLFHSRLYRPERCLLAVAAPVRIDRLLERIRDGGDAPLGGWKPPAPVPGSVDLLPREYRSGLFWNDGEDLPEAPRTPPGAVRVALVLQLPDATLPNAAGWLLMHSVLTLGGTGGRLERMQEEVGLAHVLWRSQVERHGDVLALVLRANAYPQEVPKLWRAYQLARESLRTVPPSTSELLLSLRRAQLEAQLPVLQDSDRLHLHARLSSLGIPHDIVATRLRSIDDPADIDVASGVASLLATPAWMIAIGPGNPRTPEVQPLAVLPEGFDPVRRNDATEENLAAADPWFAQARAACGDEHTFARLDGFDASANTTADRAPGADDQLRWRSSGDLVRERTVLGQHIVTTLAGDSWSEVLGDVRKSLGSADAEALRRSMRRHPIMLLAAHARGALRFRPIARRPSGDREMFVFETSGGGFDRLRVHIDTESHLVRTVESWEPIDGTLVHIRESWSDYRQAGPLRVPHRRRSEWNDGLQQSETVFTDWTPALRDG